VADDEALAGKILHSRPYYGTGYLLVQRRRVPHAKSAGGCSKGASPSGWGPRRARWLITVSEALAFSGGCIATQLATLKALNDGDIDFAYLWANDRLDASASPDFALEIVPNYAYGSVEHRGRHALGGMWS